jgi:beta-glucanase (GH16 family)
VATTDPAGPWRFSLAWNVDGAWVDGTPVTLQVAGMAAPAAGSVNPAVYRLVFADEFDGVALDRAVWRTDYWNGGNGELQEYADTDAQGNYVVSKGTLKLVARRDAALGRAYTSGVITTQGRAAWAAGRVVMRAKAPRGPGLWPALWLMPAGGGCGAEIDVMEYVNDAPGRYHATLLRSCGAWSDTSAIETGVDLSAGFHTYEAEWGNGELIWRFDGREVKRVRANVPTEPMFLLVNLAVGGRWPGNPGAGTHFPVAYEIDYIRVYQQG